jgi:hypothetical protein
MKTSIEPGLPSRDFVRRHQLARSAGATELVALPVIKLGGPYVGLGQEAHPDGSGPLAGPLPDPGADQD